MLKAFSISNKRGEILFISTFEPSVTKDAFYPFLSEISSSPHGDPPPAFSKDEHNYVYIFRDDLYWACIMGSGRLTKQCGHMLITDSLCQLHRVCSTLCGTITQHSITSNLTLIAEVVQETMNGGFLQMQAADKLQSHIYSSVVTAKESSVMTAAPGLFGIEKSAPCTAAQQSALAVDNSKRELYVDVVEKVWASVASNGTVIRAEVTGSIIARCFLAGNPLLTITLNSPLCSTPLEGFSTGARMSEVEFGTGVEVAGGETGRQLSVITSPGHEVTIARYTVSPDHPHLLPFNLAASFHSLTASDCELRLKLTSNTGMGTLAPQVTFRAAAPPTTAAIMSRTSGPKDQNIKFSPEDKTITWTISQFPGGSYAQAFIRMVDAGGNATIDSGELDFEVSRWVCSGIRVERVKLNPALNTVSKWVRYLTTSDSVSIRLS
ncbi:AP-4 complex subunit mu-1-like isoform X1 [Penaeus chinensis]|uniref:AP-4 complex subunit mu-1-like isoform X1 n=2 Tax=Penaeus chinensis TaxID=139456 RepID=UPI001FB58AB0|nr:AP-4 complex subunit mu-1-like isoform X1 [Penaeus chinensis]